MFFKNDPYYFPEVPTVVEETEEFPPQEEADKSETPLEIDGNLFVGNAIEDEESFSCFIDGTYRIARTAMYGGVPIYIASITAAMTERAANRRLKEIGLERHLTVVLFPFDAFNKTFKNSIGPKIRDFKKYLEEEYDALPDHELRGNSVEVLQRRKKNIWMYSDVTYIGLKGAGFTEKDVDITEQNIFDEGKIYSRVRARVRVLMSILETANLKYYREHIERQKYKDQQENWVLIDGTINNFLKFFCAKTNQADYYPLFNKVVGFIKTIRRNPIIDVRQIYALKEKEFLVSIASRNDEEIVVRKEMEEDNLIGENVWGFIYLRFRRPIGYPEAIFTSKGVVKLQMRITEEHSEADDKVRLDRIKEKARKVAGLAVKERFPLPADRFRIWKEAVVIEETEKIAKGRLLSQEWLKNKGWSL